MKIPTIALEIDENALADSILVRFGQNVTLGSTDLAQGIRGYSSPPARLPKLAFFLIFEGEFLNQISI